MGSSVVAKPANSALMLETILCRVLSLALSDGAHGDECVLTAGGRFHVDHHKLQMDSAADTSSSFSRRSPTRARSLKKLHGKVRENSMKRRVAGANNAGAISRVHSAAYLLRASSRRSEGELDA